MDLQSVEAVVRRLFSDAEFRASASVNSSVAFAEYHLDGEQEAALSKLCESLSRDEGLGITPQNFWF